MSSRMNKVDLDILPNEVWCEIFAKMKAKDRKQYRITCQRLKNCCNSREIQKSEKLHLPGVSHLEDIVSTLLSSERSIMNLKFSNYRFDGVDLPLWDKCGHKIEQLELEYCTINPASMQKILTDCTRLSHLALRYVYFVEHKLKNAEFSLFISQINQNKVVAGCIKTLVIITDENITLKGLKSLISIFPNVKNLEFKFLHVSPWPDEHSYPGECELKSYSCQDFAKFLASSLPQLENLKVHIPDECKCDKFIHETSFPRLKTAEFSKGDEFTNIHDERIIYLTRVYRFTPSSGFKDVTSIEIPQGRRLENIIQVLQELPNLRKITMTLGLIVDFKKFSLFYECLANSKLEKVEIDNTLRNGWWFSLLYKMVNDRRLPINSTVKELKLTNQTPDDTFISLFLKCFSALTHLKLIIKGKEANFANIFYEKNLKCIQLESSERRVLPHNPCTLQVQNITPDVIIENLEYLRIEIGILKEMLAQTPAICFPNLRFLHISYFEALKHLGKNSRKHASEHASKRTQQKKVSLMPWELKCLPLYHLEGVYMEVCSCTNDISVFFSNPEDFPRIQYIGIRMAVSDILPYKQWFASWFDHCPCLTTIFLMNQGGGICLYYDPVRGEIRECSLHERFMPFNVSFRSIIYDFDEDSNPGINMFQHFRNLKSFFDLWVNST